MASFGRLTRVRIFGDRPNSVAYIVALPEATDAIALIKATAASRDDAIEDLGRVSEGLLHTIGLLSGQYVPADTTEPRATSTL
jgi:hypothetical protein